MYRTDFWTLWEKSRVGCFERMYIIYSETSPAQVRCMRQVLGPVHWEDPEESGGEGGGRGDRDGEYM